MNTSDIRAEYLKFFKHKDHAVIPPAPLVPVDDPTTLFTPFGMQQLVPYLKGKEHPMGNRLVDSQPSFRSDDIEEIGDNRHTTFFEMLGNWSLGDYFKEEQLPWFFTFVTQVVKLDPSRLYVTVFAGDESVPQDKASVKIWQELFHTQTPARPGKDGFDPQTKIYLYGSKKNWWSRAGVPENMPPGEIGGPDSEVFFDYDPQGELHLHEQSEFKDQLCHINCDCGRFLEIGNSVFMEYIKKTDGDFAPLPNKNVDFGGGLERLAAAGQDTPDVFQINSIKPIISSLTSHTDQSYEGTNQTAMRIITDHIRAATFIINAGVKPSNKLQGYFLRRLLRRSRVKLRQLNPDTDPSQTFNHLVDLVVSQYQDTDYFKNFDKSKSDQLITEEMGKFEKVLQRGLKEIEKHRGPINAKFTFDLFQTYGLPFEISQEILADLGHSVSKTDFDKARKDHREQSRAASTGMFKGGLAGDSDQIVRYHTATHLLHQALRDVLGDHVEQMGSNITNERLRFDFKHPQKLEPEELQQIESVINQKIEKDLPVHRTLEPKQKALKSGALAFFKETYPEKVSVYTIGQDPANDWYSKELCGGPHVSSTGEIGPVTIKKEQSVGAGARRIYLTFAPDNQ